MVQKSVFELLVITTFFLPASVITQDVSLWVSFIRGYSSQYSQTDFAAIQVIGKADVYPAYGSYAKAWTQKDGHFTADQYVEVGYAERLYIERIHIYETYNAGGVKEIKSLNPSGQWETIWNTTKVQAIGSSRMFSPKLQRKNYPTDSLHFTVDCTVAATYVEIDAIEVIGTRPNGNQPALNNTITSSEKTCAPGQLHFRESCYMIGRRNETWISAQNTCRAFGGKLAEIESQEEDLFLRIHLLDERHEDNHKSINYWIGGSDLQQEGTWIWVVDHTKMSYNDFNTGQPDNADGSEHCLRMSGFHDFRWEDSSCDLQSLSICEMKAFNKGIDPITVIG